MRVAGLGRPLRALAGRWRGLSANSRGGLWILATAAIMTCQAAIVKQLGGGLHSFEIVFFRCFLSIFLLLALVPFLARGHATLWRTRRLPMHLVRSATGIAAMACSFYAFTRLPLADATAYAYTMPLFMIVLAVLLLGERVRWRRWSATAVGFTGVLIMARPGGAIAPAALVALLGALMSALAFMLIKKLAVTDRALVQIFYFALVGTAISLGPALAVWRTPELDQFGLLLAIAALGTAGQLCAVMGWHVGEATAVAPVDYARLLFAGAIGFFVFAEVPDAMMVVGAVVIVASTLYIARREAVIRKRAMASS